MLTEMPKSARIYVAGHRGLVGSSILRRLAKEGFTNLLTATREQLDLRDQAAVNYWFKANRQDLSSCYALFCDASGIAVNQEHFSDHCFIKAEEGIPTKTGAMYRYYLNLFFSRIPLKHPN